MTVLTYLAMGAVSILGFWKIYELIFNVAAKRKSEAERALVLLNMFFAEFTYKTMNNSSEYKSAPKEIYRWLDLNFKEWAEVYKNRELENEKG